MKHLFYSTLLCLCFLTPQANYSMEQSQLRDEQTQTYCIFHNMLPEQHLYQPIPQSESETHHREYRTQTKEQPSACCHCCPCICIGCCSISILGLLLAGLLGVL